MAASIRTDLTTQSDPGARTHGWSSLRRFPGRLVASGIMLGIAGCTIRPPPPPPAPQAAVSHPSGPSTATITAEVARLRQDLHTDVPQGGLSDAEPDAKWIALAKRQLASAGVVIHRPQLLVVVDRNPAVQQLRIVMADPSGPWQVIGGSKVSTGQSGRRGYFITPTGVFQHNGHILDYRALGTFNENHIRGLGLEGMRVWDFGWQHAEKGWQAADRDGEIRLLLHATDPDYLAPRLGHPASKGCIRIPATMNQFLDIHGVLDRNYEEAGRSDPRNRAVLSPDRQPSIIAGNKLVVVDSSEAGAPRNAMTHRT